MSLYVLVTLMNFYGSFTLIPRPLSEKVGTGLPGGEGEFKALFLGRCR
ncbi:MAG: hypothetical protein ACOCQ6_02255 [Bacteroidota bacterium]